MLLLFVIVTVPVSVSDPVPAIVAPAPVRLIGPVPAMMPLTVRLLDSVSDVPLWVVVPVLTTNGPAKESVEPAAMVLLFVIVTGPVSVSDPVPVIVAPTPVRLIGP